MVNAYEIEGHGIYWEVDRDGTYVETYSSLDAVRAGFPDEQITVYTLADWSASVEKLGDEFEGVTDPAFVLEPGEAVTL